MFRDLATGAAITGSLVEEVVRDRAAGFPLQMLTTREQEVLRLLAGDNRVKEMFCAR